MFQLRARIGSDRSIGNRVALTRATSALLAAFLVARVGHAAARTRLLEMEITLPNGAAAGVRVPEGEGAVITLPDRSRYGFVPTLPKAADTPVTVTIWDVQRNPPDQMGRVEIPSAAVRVQSDTSPSFGIRIVRVIKPK